MIITNGRNTPKKQNQPSFKNGGTLAMNYLSTNQAIGATAVDLVSMVFPRMAVDYTRTPEAGAETARRELLSCALYPAVGLMGLGAAHILSPFIPNNYGVNYKKIGANSEEIDVLSKSWNRAFIKNGKDMTKKDVIIKDYLQDVIGSISGLDGNKKVSIKEDKRIKNEIIDELSNLLKHKNDYEIPKDRISLMNKKITAVTGASSNLYIKTQDHKEIKTNANEILKDTYSMARAFMQDKVAEEFKNTNNHADNKFIKSLKQFTNKKMIIGIGIASTLGFTMQAFNRWLTKKKTGSDAFVVYKDNAPVKKDKSTEFQAKKALTAAGITAFAVSTIGKIKDLPNKLQFKGIKPTINQYKFIYGLTIAGRVLASSDNNELRETTTRDILGFTSWLILGDVAGKRIAKHFEKKHNLKLLNTEKTANGSNNFVKLVKSSLKSHSEIIYSENKKNIGKNFKEALKSSSKKTKKALKYINISQLGGYASSALLLGVAIPLLNKKVTDKKTKTNNTPANEVNNQEFSQTQFLKDKSKSFSGSVAFSRFIR